MKTILNEGDAFFLEDGKEYQVYEIVEYEGNPYLIVREVPLGNKKDFFDLDKFPLILVLENIKENDELELVKVTDPSILKEFKKMKKII